MTRQLSRTNGYALSGGLVQALPETRPSSPSMNSDYLARNQTPEPLPILQRARLTAIRRAGG
jgi:hypothetical protein